MAWTSVWQEPNSIFSDTPEDEWTAAKEENERRNCLAVSYFNYAKFMCLLRFSIATRTIIFDFARG